MTWIDEIRTYGGPLASALGVTLELAAISLGIGFGLGLPLALLRMSRSRASRLVAHVYVEFFRTTPLIPQLLWVYFVIPNLTGVDLNAFTAGYLTLGLNTAAYACEIYRAGLQAVGQGQAEAAFVLGLTRTQTFRYILLRQAIVIVIPPIFVTIMTVMKGTAYLSLLAVPEFTYVSGLVSQQNFKFVSVFGFAGVIYFLLIYPVGVFGNLLERRLRVSVAKSS